MIENNDELILEDVNEEELNKVIKYNEEVINNNKDKDIDNKDIDSDKIDSNSNRK